MNKKLMAVLLSGILALNMWVPALQAEAGNVNIGGDYELDVEEGVEDWIEGDTGLEEVPGDDFDAWVEGRSGKCGPEATWLLSLEGVLTIGGSGAVTAPSGYMKKLADDKDLAVKELIIEDGITSLCEEAFCGFEKLQGTLEIPESVESIGEAAFYETDGLEVVVIENAECVIYDSAKTFSDSTALSGYVNSTAHKYAEKYNREFICIEHVYGEWEKDKEATCIEDGREKKVCQGCGDEITRPVEATGHDYAWVLDKEATENEAGLKHEECRRCQDKRSENTVIDKLTHIHETKKTEAVAAECEKDGNIEYYTCVKCPKLYTDEKGNLEITEEELIVEKLGHDYLETVTEPTTSAGGYTTYTCKRCNHTYKDNYTDPIKDTSGFGTENVYRIYGDTRYQTSMEIANVLKAQLEVEKFETVIVAYGENYADALAGSYLAAKKNAPILLVKSSVSKEVADYISKNLVPGGRIYILGGTAVIDEKIVKALKPYGNVKRLSGANRYETNLAILKEAGVAGEDILVCTGTGFADSLSASALGKPILLVDKKLSGIQKQYLKELSGNKYYIIGGTAAVSTTVEKEIKVYSKNVKRLSGNDRYETSVLVAKEFFDKPSAAVLAYAQNFPDGLSGGPLAMSRKAPLILTKTGAEKQAEKYAKEKNIGKGAVLGGERLISDDAVKKILGVEEIAIWE